MGRPDLFSKIRPRGETRLMNLRDWLFINIPTLSLGALNYFMSEKFADTDNWMCLDTIIVFYLLANVRAYFYLITLYYSFNKRRRNP